MQAKKRKILIAGPGDQEQGADFTPTLDTCSFFSQGGEKVWYSLNPGEVEEADGVVIPGGLPDVNPDYWGEKNTGCKVIDEDLDRLQLAMVARAVELNKPLLGICRGHQIVSVYFGASLIQHISCEKAHAYDPVNPRFHDMYNIPGTILYEAYGPVVRCNSVHHQAIRFLPKCLQAVQLWCRKEEDAQKYIKMAENYTLQEGSHDCIIEAVVHREYPFLGIQWHPEWGGKFACEEKTNTKIRQIFQEMMDKKEKIREGY
ncbi:gamma-glutamyl-gamma-aminobutyrate hydrolase family protein [Clostridium transplantifaecale]|uniref:gamma-glutamyl-gamma-aminobutyrate hydrolase family protein n=1 Tax=Clostridium transplantifaecale TaxID=2479838 RepID=UPI000F63AF89|nr:gamma-glutamyl-gamma-aminobutyrate hydrolase family protein [Clostridium transplantifaecale]